MSAKHNIYEKLVAGILVIVVIFGLMHSARGDDAGTFQKVEPNKIPDELAMLADVTRANYEKIKTWQGKSSFESTYFYEGKYAADLVKLHAGVTIKEPNDLAVRAEGTKDFKINLEKNLSFRSMNRSKPMEYIDLDRGLSHTSLEGSLETTKIITGEYEIESSPYTRKKDGTILSRSAEKRPRNPSQTDFDESDPRHCFSIGQPPWVLLSMMSEGIRRYNKDPNGAEGNTPNSVFSNVTLEKAQTANGITYRVQLSGPSFEWKYTFEGEKGFNPTHIEVKNGKGIKITESTTDWVKIQGIFLPVEQQVFQYDGNDGRARRQAKSTFSDMQVNMSLPEGTFSLNNLGLHNGDKFVDKIAGKEYKYQDTNLVPIAEPNNPPK